MPKGFNPNPNPSHFRAFPKRQVFLYKVRNMLGRRKGFKSVYSKSLDNNLVGHKL